MRVLAASASEATFKKREATAEKQAAKKRKQNGWASTHWLGFTEDALWEHFVWRGDGNDSFWMTSLPSLFGKVNESLSHKMVLFKQAQEVPPWRTTVPLESRLRMGHVASCLWVSLEVSRKPSLKKE